MLAEIVKRTQELAQERQANLMWAAIKIANIMTNDEINAAAAELGSRSATSSAVIITTGKNKRGEEKSAMDIENARSDWASTIEAYVTTIANGREWRG